MSPEKTRQLLLMMLENEAFSVYISIIPSPTVVIHKQGDPCQRCFLSQVTQSPHGPRAHLDKTNQTWQFCDSIIFFDPFSLAIWLVAVLSIPKGGSILLGASYDGYRLLQRSSAKTEESPADIIQAAIDAQKRKDILT